MSLLLYPWMQDLYTKNVNKTCSYLGVSANSSILEDVYNNTIEEIKNMDQYWKDKFVSLKSFNGD